MFVLDMVILYRTVIFHNLSLRAENFLKTLHTVILLTIRYRFFRYLFSKKVDKNLPSKKVYWSIENKLQPVG